MSKLEINKDYKKWLIDLKSKIKNSQIKAALQVNSELIALYWDIGAMICEKQAKSNWGSGLIIQLSKDLKIAFPKMGGFSETNLRMCKRFFLFYSEEFTIREQLVHELTNEIKPKCEQLVHKIPWGHHILILKKIKNRNEALFYVAQTIENNWSRSVLEYQIEPNLYNRQGKAITNFKQTLPEPESDLAQQLLKDPYNFDFLTLTKKILTNLLVLANFHTTNYLKI